MSQRFLFPDFVQGVMDAGNGEALNDDTRELPNGETHGTRTYLADWLGITS